MNKKGMEMVITAVILIAVGLVVLLAIAYAVTDGFKKFRTGTDLFLDSTIVKQAISVCNDACSDEIALTYCCQKWNYQGDDFKCTDSRLKVSCSDINCDSFSCNT